MKVKPTTKDAYRLMHEGSLALAEASAAGIRIDVDRLGRTIEKTDNRIKKLTKQLKEDDVWRDWKKRWGMRSSLGSRHQLIAILVGEAEEGEKRKADKNALEKLDHPFVEKYLEVEKLKKLRNTYLQGVKREVCKGYLHPSFPLNMVRTFRSSSDSPNFQNIPIRDVLVGKLIRSCFVPREGRMLLEVDYSALEFRVAACFWTDDAMVAYASNPSLDIHRDMAAECYMLDVDQVESKGPRFYAKNQFVFPTLYGSYYCNTARNLWNAIETASLKTKDGQPLYEYLADRGITKLGACNPKEPAKRGTFEYHIKEVERDFHEKFPQWAKRKEVWLKKYQQQGYFDMMTGFRCQGILKRNDLYNWPVQGPAFHLLLWSLIQMMKWLKKEKMESLIVGQIHDSMAGDVVLEELDAYLEKIEQVMTKDVREHWDWVVTPLSIEAEGSTENWFKKETIEVGHAA